MNKLNSSVITAVIIFGLAAVISIPEESGNQSDVLMRDARLLKSFAEYAQRIARNHGRAISLTIGKAGDKGHAAIIRDGTTLWELTTDDCLLAPLNYTVTFDRNGFPTDQASITITNGSELYLDILPDGSTQLNSADIPD